MTEDDDKPPGPIPAFGGGSEEDLRLFSKAFEDLRSRARRGSSGVGGWIRPLLDDRPSPRCEALDGAPFVGADLAFDYRPSEHVVHRIEFTTEDIEAAIDEGPSVSDLPRGRIRVIPTRIRMTVEEVEAMIENMKEDPSEYLRMIAKAVEDAS